MQVEPGPSDQDRELDTQEGIAARALNTLFDQCIAGAVSPPTHLMRSGAVPHCLSAQVSGV